MGASVIRDPKGHVNILAELFEMYGTDNIKSRITARFSLARESESFVRLEHCAILDKIVVMMEDI